MSSFGSSLINKGRKIVPKAGGRRRPGGGGAAALAVQDAASVTSGRSSVDTSQTPQPDQLLGHTAPQPGVPTSEDSFPDADVPVSSDGLATGPHGATTRASVTSGVTSQTETTQVSDKPFSGSASTQQPDRALDVPEQAKDAAVPAISSGASRRRTLSPTIVVSGPSKRRRVDRGSLDVAEGTRSPAPSSSVPPRGIDDDEIPVVQISKRAPSKPSTKASKAALSSIDDQGGGQTGDDSLDEYEALDASADGATPASPSRSRTARSTVAPLLMASVAGPKPRAKGTRRNQWQVTTQADLAPSGSREEAIAIEQAGEAGGTENDPITVVGPKVRKVRKDKGVKKGPIARRRQSAEVEEEDLTDTRRTRSLRTRPTVNEDEELASAAKRGRAIAPQPAPSPRLSVPQATSESLDATSAEEETPEPGSTSARLKNAQKRRARQLAALKIRSGTSASETAAAIDIVVAQSIEGQSSQLPPSRSNPLFRVQAQEARSRSRRSTSMATDTTEGATVTEDGTRQRKRYRRQATPPGNETVFIAEKVTPMISLVGRDTENRVGMRSNMEMKMRDIDWKDVKLKHAEKFKEAAFLKGKRKTNDFDVIFNRQETPMEVDDGERKGAEGDDDDESILEARVQAREKRFGKSTAVQLTMINGEHRMDDTRAHGNRASEDVEGQIAEGGEVEVDELIKPRFNVHTFVTWNRREPEERIYQSSRWNEEETEKFYEALRCCGVDFGSMAEWFPHRIRRSIKRKFNVEERINPQRIDETLNAHMMLVTGEEMGDNGTGWDLATFHANGAGLDLKDPRAVEEQLARERLEKEIEIEAARVEYEAEKANKKLAGVQSDNEDEEEEGEEDDEEEEEDEEAGLEETIGDVIRDMQQKELEKKSGKVAADAAPEQDEQEGNNDDDEQNAESDGDQVVPTVEEDEEEYYDLDEDEALPDWDDED